MAIVYLSRSEEWLGKFLSLLNALFLVLLEDVDSWGLLSWLNSIDLAGLLLVEGPEEGKETNGSNTSDASIIEGEASLLNLLVLCCK